MALNIVFGTAGADILQTSLIAPTVVGGDWEVYGLNGNDQILLDALPFNTPDIAFGGGRNDLIRGNDGPNRLFGDDPAGTQTGAPGNDTIFGGNEPPTATGVSLGDYIDGQDGNDQLFGEGGDDTILGGAGKDRMDGGDGRDSMLGGDGTDIMSGGLDGDSMSGGSGGDRMDGNDGDDVMFGDDGSDLLRAGDGNDKASGGAGNDTVEGDRGNDALNGDRGDDRIYGGRGIDTLTGGAGAADRDIFVYAQVNEGPDLITDFASGVDLIELDQSAFGLTSPVGVGINFADWGVFGGFGAADASAQRIALVANQLFYNASAAGGDLLLLATFAAGVPVNNFTDYVIVP